MKLGELNARLKQMEVALDAAQLSKQSAEADAALVREKSEEMEGDVKQLQLMVGYTAGFVFLLIHDFTVCVVRKVNKGCNPCK